MDPILLQIGGFYLAWYGLFVAAALVAGTALSAWLARGEGVDIALILDLLIVVVVGMLVGARAFYIVTVWDRFVADPLPYLISRDGFVFLGGLVGATASGALFVRWKRLPFWRLSDIVAPVIPLGHGLGRIGCHFTGCCHGGICPPAWASFGLRVPPGVLERPDGTLEVVGGWAYFEQLDAGLIPKGAAYSLPVWPVQLMEAGFNFLLCIALLALFFRRRWNGQVFLVYAIVYSIGRFGLEMLRGDAGRGVYDLGFVQASFSQLVGVGLLGAALWGYWLGRQGRLPGQDRAFPKAVLYAGAPRGAHSA